MLIKATYRNETRRFSITCDDQSQFPTWEQLYNQLYRIFPISSDIYLSTVLFSPDASRNARIMVGREIHNAEQYNNCLTFLPSSQSWKQPMLRFSVYDNTPHKSSTRVGIGHSPNGIPFSHIPPPPIILPAMPSNLPQLGGAREQVNRLIENFKVDLSWVLDQHLGQGQGIGSSDRPQRVASVRPQTCLNGNPGCQGTELQCLGCHVPRCSICSAQSQGVCSGGKLHLFAPLNSNPVQESFPGSYRPAYIHSATGSALSPAELPVLQASPAPPAARSAPSPRDGAIHANVYCDQCRGTPIGTRHKCLDCPDYDLCDTCMASNGAERHNPFHQFVGIEQPGRVVVHRILDGDRPHRTASDSTAIPAAREQAPPVLHLASCDLCDSTIQGDRYKCLQCPDYDTCSACFSITNEHHPHSFVKISKREDLIIRSSASNSMHYATCDACKKTIYGTRYKCMHIDCPDYDLCSVCEAHPIPLHNPRHALLKMRHPDALVPPRPLHTQLPTARSQSTVQTSPTNSPRTASPSLPAGSITPIQPSTPVAAAPASEITFTPQTNTKTASLTTLIETDVSESHPRKEQEETESHQTLQENSDSEIEHLREELAARTLQEQARLATAMETSRVVSPPPSLSLASPPPSLTSLLIGLDIMSTSSHKAESQSDAESRFTSASVARSEADDATIAHGKPTSPVIVSEKELISSRVLTQHAERATFPPGAEFVKSWLMINDGNTAWANDTKLALVSSEGAETLRMTEPHVGSLAPGELTEVTTGELKAPEVSGPVKMNWQLRDGEHGFFGDLISFEIEVAEPDSDGAMGSSSIIMPASAASNSNTTRSLTAGRTHSTLSLISLPSDVMSEYADAADVTPISPSDSSVEYVVLSGSDSD